LAHPDPAALTRINSKKQMQNTTPIICFIGIGSNLDDPPKQIRQAIQNITNTDGIRFIQCSSVYVSKPLGPQDQPDFFNAVCMIETSLNPLPLLDILQGIELRQGRIKTRHWGERCIDLDILLYGQLQINTDRLTIPHPELLHRDFAWMPLLDIAPETMLPNGVQIQSLKASLPCNTLSKSRSAISPCYQRLSAEVKKYFSRYFKFN